MIKLILAFLYKFWPIFIPFIIYGIWRYLTRKKRKKQSISAAAMDPQLYIAILSAFAIAMIVFVYSFMQPHSGSGYYEPTHFDEEGRIVPGQTKSK